MEHESEGGQTMQGLEFENRVRTEANLGFQQVRSIEHQLRNAPKGFLGKDDGSDAQNLRKLILNSSASIVGSFSRIISLLSAPPSANSFRNIDCSLLDRGSAGVSGNRIESPASPTLTFDGSLPHSPRRALSAPAAANPASPAASPCHTPHSGSGTSEGSPPNPASSPQTMESDGEAPAATASAATRRPRQSSNEESPSADAELTERRALSKKRKFMPKYSCKQQAHGTDPGNDGPPNDGHTWRKYGQKDILGSRYPRSYYRCTHKTEVGCLAIKYVQRSDEEPSLFDVTYRGNHTCMASLHQHTWPFPFSPEQLMALARPQQLPPSDPTCLPGALNFPGLCGNHMNTSAPQTRVMPRTDDVTLSRTSSGFSCALPTSCGPPTSITLDNTSASQVMAPDSASRFGLSPTSVELETSRFPVKPEVSNPSGTQPYNSSRPSPLESLFAPNSSLLNKILGRPSCSQGEYSPTFVEGPLHDREFNNLKPVSGQVHPGELPRTDANISEQMNKLPEAQHEVPWRQGGTDTDDFQPLPADADDTVHIVPDAFMDNYLFDNQFFWSA